MLTTRGPMESRENFKKLTCFLMNSRPPYRSLTRGYTDSHTVVTILGISFSSSPKEMGFGCPSKIGEWPLRPPKCKKLKGVFEFWAKGTGG